MADLRISELSELTSLSGTEEMTWESSLVSYRLSYSTLLTELGSDLSISSTLAGLDDVTLSGTARGDVFYRGATDWNNLAAGTAGLPLVTGGAGADPSWSGLDASATISGTFADARIAESNVTQHQAALSITESQISDLAHTSLANPTASVGLSAVNGVATTAMRSDAAPPLDQGISPTWTGTHDFSGAIVTGLAPGNNNEVLTSDGAGGFVAESALTYTANTLKVDGTNAARMEVDRVSTSFEAVMRFRTNGVQDHVMGSVAGGTNFRFLGKSGSTLQFLSGTGGNIQFGISGNENVVNIDSTGTTSVKKTDAVTSTVSTVQTLSHRTSNPVANNFGGELALNLETSTGDERQAAGIKWLWDNATDATRKGKVVVSAWDFSGSTDVITADVDTVTLQSKGTARAVRLRNLNFDLQIDNLSSSNRFRLLPFGTIIYFDNYNPLASSASGDIQFRHSWGAGYTASVRLTMTQGGNHVFGSAALATTATDGFLYIPSSAGAPTGTPTSYTGRVPLHYDSTNNRFYIYNGSWRSVAVA